MTETKQLLARTLMQMLETQPLDKITVKDITQRSGVSRQSFYYYFDDMYALVEWIIMREAEGVLSDYSRIDNWQMGYVLMLYWAINHKAMVLNIFRAVPRDYIERFFKRVLTGYILRVVRQQAQGMLVTEEQCVYIANFFTLSLEAVTLDWLETGLKESPEELAERTGVILQGGCQKGLAYFEKKNGH